MSQKTDILAALKSGPLTPMAALVEFGCFRLAARIEELRRAGYEINTNLIELRSGKTVAEYVLVR